MKKITVISLILVLLASFALLTACSGGSEADKAYEAWSAENTPKEKAANDEFSTAFKAAQEQGDRATQIAAMEKYLSVIKPIREQLAAIDKAKLSDKLKSGYEAELVKIDESIKGIEENLAIQKDILAEEQGAPAEEPAAEEAPAEEPAADDEGGYVEEEAGEEE